MSDESSNLRPAHTTAQPTTRLRYALRRSRFDVASTREAGTHAPLLDLSDFGLRTMIASGLGGGAQECDELGDQHRKFANGRGHRRAGRQQPPPGGCRIPGHTRTRGTHLGGQCHRRCRGNRGRRALLRNIGRLAHIQEALNYFYTVRSLVKRGVVSPAALSVPAYANVMACVVEFDDFFSAYGRKWA